MTSGRFGVELGEAGGLSVAILQRGFPRWKAWLKSGHLQQIGEGDYVIASAKHL